MRIKAFFKVRYGRNQVMYLIGSGFEGASAAADELAGHWGVTVGEPEEVTLAEVNEAASEDDRQDDPEILKNVLLDYEGDGMYLFSRDIGP